MECNSALPLETLLSIPKNEEEKKDLDANRKIPWWLRDKRVGYHQNASIIKTFDGMQEVHVNKNMQVYFLYDQTKDAAGVDASKYSPVENIGEALGYKGPFWDEWLRRISRMEEKIDLRFFDRGLPEVR